MGLALAGCGFFVLAQNQDPVPPAFEKSSGTSEGTVAPDPFDPDGSSPKMVQVQVEYLELSHAAITCIKGQYMLVTVQSPKDAKGDADMTRKVMVFVKCDILPVK